MKCRFISGPARAALLVFALTHATSFAAPEVPRRGVLGMGVLGFFGLGTRSTPKVSAVAPPAPAVLNAVSPALTEFRKTGLAQVLRGLQKDRPRRQLNLNEPLSEFERLIIEDWRKHDPEGRAFIVGEIERFENLYRELEQTRERKSPAFNETAEATIRYFVADYVSPDGIYERARDARRDLLALITDWPWSTFEWSKVFVDRIGEAEAELARELGTMVDVAQVYQLTETAFDPEHGLLAVVARSNFVAPIYSEEVVEALARKLDPMIPPVARHIRERAQAPNASDERVRAMAVTMADQGWTYRCTADAPLCFELHDGHANSGRDAERLAPRYLRLRDGLSIMLQRLGELPPSTMKRFLKSNVAAVIDDLDRELETLPDRVAATDRKHFVHIDPARPRWHAFLRPAADSQPALRWASVLRTTAERLGVAWPEIGSAAAAAMSAAESVAPGCADHLVEKIAAPVMIEHRIDESLPIGSAAERVPVSPTEDEI